MSIQIPPGFSVSVPVSATFGPEGLVSTDITTPLTNVLSADTTKVRVMYPDPTAGITNPLRSVRVDMDASVPNNIGANISARYTSPYDGAIRTMSTVVTAIKPPDAGTAAFGTPSTPFFTPAS